MHFINRASDSLRVDSVRALKKTLLSINKSKEISSKELISFYPGQNKEIYAQ